MVAAQIVGNCTRYNVNTILTFVKQVYAFDSWMFKWQVNRAAFERATLYPWEDTNVDMITRPALMFTEENTYANALRQYVLCFANV